MGDAGCNPRAKRIVNKPAACMAAEGRSVVSGLTWKMNWTSPMKRGCLTTLVVLARGIGDRGVVVATLINDESYGRAQDGALGGVWVAAEPFGNHSPVEEIPHLPICAEKR